MPVRTDDALKLVRARAEDWYHQLHMSIDPLKNHADRFSQSEIGIFIFRDAGKQRRRKLGNIGPLLIAKRYGQAPALPRVLYDGKFHLHTGQ